MCLYLREIRYNFDLSSLWKAYLGHRNHLMITEFWIFKIFGIGNSTMTHKRIFQRHHESLCSSSFFAQDAAMSSQYPNPTVSKNPIQLSRLSSKATYSTEAIFLKLDFSSFPPLPPTHPGPKYGLCHLGITSVEAFLICVFLSHLH